MIIVWILLGLVVLLAVVGVVMYNGLIGLRNKVEEGWRQIDVELKRRHDLIPNLVETVKGYAAHEQSTLEAVITARNQAVAAQGPGAKAKAEDVLTGAVSKLFALAESYPQLRAVEGFTSLQGSLREIEDAIGSARQYYNAVVRDLNTKIAQFPNNIVAGLFAFQPREFFELSSAAEREAPKVNFTTPAA
jgi:LemA protein